MGAEMGRGWGCVGGGGAGGKERGGGRELLEGVAPATPGFAAKRGGRGPPPSRREASQDSDNFVVWMGREGRL